MRKSAEAPNDSYDAHVRVYRARKGIQEVLTIHDNFPTFSRTEAMILQTILEKGPLRGKQIQNTLEQGGFDDGTRGTYVFLRRLMEKGILTAEVQGRSHVYGFTDKWAAAFRLWKLMGKEFIS